MSPSLRPIWLFAKTTSIVGVVPTLAGPAGASSDRSRKSLRACPSQVRFEVGSVAPALVLTPILR